METPSDWFQPVSRKSVGHFVTELETGSNWPAQPWSEGIHLSVWQQLSHSSHTAAPGISAPTMMPNCLFHASLLRAEKRN